MNRAERIWSKWALLVIALMVPLGAQALGLGEARVESFLNQKLDVRMRLLDATEDNLDSLTVASADPEDYERLGLMAESLALRLDVRVDRSVSPPVVRVTSDRVVTDPVVQLLIDARWSSGRVLREYTLFLDPATVAVDAPAPATATRSPAAASEVRSRSEQPSASSSASAGARAPDAKPQAVARSRDGSYGPVESGDTLWSIAQTNLPAGDVTMDQMMIAIVELNPRAFRGRNINQLLRGAELRLPDADRARALDAAAAAAEVAAQNRAFRQRASADTPVASASDSARTDSAEASATADASGREAAQSADRGDTGGSEAAESRLSLVPPGDEESGSGLSDQEVAEVANLRQRLARAEEELYAARQEAEEFQSRVEELETLVRDNPGGVGIQDAELAGLQRTLRAAREATREGADPAMRSRVSRRLDNYLEQFSDAGEDGQPAPDGGSAPLPDADASSAAGAGTSEVDMADAQADASASPAQSPMPDESSSGFLGNPMTLLFIGLIVLLLLLVAVRLGLRRRTAAETAGAPARDVETRAQPEADSDTPLKRARALVASRPGDLSAHLALLQALAADGDEARFGDALEAMFGHVESGGEPEWREALELAERITPDHSLVKGSSDWLSDTEKPDDSEAASELDDDAEVDDLMSRLDADLEESDLEESDDRDWLGDEDSATATPDGPLLRDDDESSPEEDSSARDEGNYRFTGTEVLDPIDAEDDSPVDFGEWEDDEERARPDGETRTGDSETADDADDLILDWDADEETEGDAEAPATTAGESEALVIGGEDDDIFAQSDDDIDVKLDLAKAYLSWNSTDSARTLLEEVEREGNEAQQQEARKLLDEAGDDSED